MAAEMTPGFGAVQNAFDRQDAELAAAVERQFRVVNSQTATGNGDINNTFELERKFRLVFVRCHFSGGAGTADLHISVDHSAGATYDTRLATVSAIGTGTDASYTVGNDVNSQPSPWTFQIDDAVRIEWTNPDPGNMTWGLEVGLALAS